MQTLVNLLVLFTFSWVRVLVFRVFFLVHFSLFGYWENGRDEMNVQLHLYIYVEITPHLGFCGFESDENHGEEEICRLWLIFMFCLHFLGRGYWFIFLVVFPLFGCWENGQNEMNVQLHQYIYTKITPRLGCSGFKERREPWWRRNLQVLVNHGVGFLFFSFFYSFGSFPFVWLLRKWTKGSERSVTLIYLRWNNFSFGLQ